MSNTANNVVHFTLPLASGATKILDMELPGPTVPKFYAKNPSIQYGVDKNASNYVAIIPITTGLAFVDMNAIIQGFASGLNYLPATFASIVTYATGGTARTVANGGDYVIGASYSSSTVVNGIAIINVRTRTVRYLPNVAPAASRFLWAPRFSDEIVHKVQNLAAVVDAQNSQLTAKIAALQVQPTSTVQSTEPSQYEKDSRSNATTGIILGSIALVCSVVAMIASLIVLFRPPGSITLSTV